MSLIFISKTSWVHWSHTLTVNVSLIMSSNVNFIGVVTLIVSFIDVEVKMTLYCLLLFHHETWLTECKYSVCSVKCATELNWSHNIVGFIYCHRYLTWFSSDLCSAGLRATLWLVLLWKYHIKHHLGAVGITTALHSEPRDSFWDL